MKYLLDTNAWIDYLNKPNSNVKAKLAGVGPFSIVACSVVKAELFFGAHNSKYPEKNLRRLNELFHMFESISFDDNAANVYGQIRFYLNKQGQPIGPYDLQIAAIALAHNFTVITHNTKEFSRVPDLLLQDWQS